MLARPKGFEPLTSAFGAPLEQDGAQLRFEIAYGAT
jgi:hypothetical protein